MDTFRAVVLGDFVPLAQSLGLDPFAILKRAQLDPQLIVDPDGRLALRSVMQVLEEAAALSGRDDFGVLLAERRTFSSLGPISLLIQHESTVRSFIKASIEFGPLLSETMSLHLEEHNDTATLYIMGPARGGSPQLMSHVMAVAKTVLAAASGGAWRPTVAHFRQTQPHWVSTYAKHFDCPLSFEEPFDGLSCPTRSLDIALPSAEPVLATYARKLLSQFPVVRDKVSVTRSVRDAIQLLLPHGTPTLSKVSATLATPPRTVQMMLRKEGETLEGLLKQVRRELAVRYIAQSRQGLTQVAYNLGFSSLSAFSRWFSGEFGVAPSAWRKASLDAPDKAGAG